MQDRNEFNAVVKVRTGLDVQKVAEGVDDDLLGGQILVATGDFYLVTHGYPTEERDGVICWDSDPEFFRVIRR